MLLITAQNGRLRKVNSPKSPHAFPHMSSITKNGKGYRVQLSVLGQRDSQTFLTKREAQQWSLQREAELRAGKGSTHTLADALARYAAEVSDKRRGWRAESLRLAYFGDAARSGLPSHLRMAAVTPEHIARWRDMRLAQVSAGSVLREIGLLSSVFETARREWRWLDANPIKMIRKPSAPEHRSRLITWSETKAMLRQLNHHPGQPAKSITQAIALCFIAARRTGMRAGEITGLTWDRYFGNYAHLPTTKTGVSRDVPLSTKARQVFDQARGFDSVLCFGVQSQTLDMLFRRARGRAGLSGFTFHDTRHCAATALGASGKVSLLEMCKIFGWRDTKNALIYFNPSVSDLANKLG